MPETITAPAPTSSAPTQPTTKPAAAASSPAPAPEPKPSQNPFKDVDAKARVVKQPDKPDPKDAKVSEDKPVEKVESKPTEKPELNELELPPEDKTRVETPLVKKLRGIANTNISKRKELEAEITRLKSESSKNGSGDVTVLTEQLSAKDKQIQELQDEIGTYRYEKNPEFVERHEKPFNSAATYAKQFVEGLMVTDGETQRKASWDNDFAHIFSLPPARAEEQAELLFGARAGGVMRQYEKLHELKANRDAALQDYHKNAGERAKQSEAERIQKETQTQKQHEEQLERSTKAFAAITKDLQDESPELYSPKPDDADSKSIFDESLALVDRAYFGRGKLKPEEAIALDAAIRLRAAAHPMLVRQIDTLKAELADLKSSIDEKDESTPGKIRLKKAPTEKKEIDFNEDLRKTLAA